MKTTFLAMLVLAAAIQRTIAADAAADKEFKTYALGSADGSNAMEIVRALIGDDGKVLLEPSTGRLLVLTTQDKQAAVAAAVRELYVTPTNVRIEVEFRGSGEQRDAGASVTTKGKVVVGSGGAHSTMRLQPRVENSLERTTSNARQELLVSSGRQGSIFIGENVGYLDWLMEYGRRYRYIEERLAWEQVGARLIAEPVVLGGGPTIRLRLTPELSGLVNGTPYHTRFALGGLDEHKEFYSRFLVGFDKSGTKQNLDIVLTAHIVPPQKP